MSAIQDKIKALQRQQAKIELLLQVKETASSLQEPADHPGVANEVEALVTTFIEAAITKLESGEAFGTADRNGDVRLTSEETAILKRLVPALSGGGVIGSLPPGAQPLNATPPSPPRIKRDPATHDERVAFAIQYRSLGGKKVKGTTDEGIPVEGPVMKLDAPFILVRNDLSEGELTQLRPENLEG